MKETFVTVKKITHDPPAEGHVRTDLIEKNIQIQKAIMAIVAFNINGN